MKYVCKVCGKEFNRNENLGEYLIFPTNETKNVFDSEKDYFVICKDDMKKILGRLADIVKNKESYTEHFLWFKKEEALLEIAKKIYSRCKCYDKNIRNLDKLGDKIYDLMCEDCWNAFRETSSK